MRGSSNCHENTESKQQNQSLRKQAYLPPLLKRTFGSCLSGVLQILKVEVH
jgi:hypothetical protein